MFSITIKNEIPIEKSESVYHGEFMYKNSNWQIIRVSVRQKRV